jgi:acetyl-CoA carboxylase biotin carboxyl carrier protein
MTRELIFTSEDVAEIVAILDKTPYARLEVRTRRFVLRVIRSGDGWTQEIEPIGDPAVTESPALSSAVTAEEAGRSAVRAPLPGTFYRSPQPGAAAFVKVGDRVRPDTVIGIIETMKLMTAIPAHCSGIIDEIIAQDASSVEVDAILMRVKHE